MNTYKVEIRHLTFIILSTSEDAVRDTVVQYLACKPEEIKSITQISGRCIVMDPTLWVCSTNKGKHHV